MNESPFYEKGLSFDLEGGYELILVFADGIREFESLNQAFEGGILHFVVRYLEFPGGYLHFTVSAHLDVLEMVSFGKPNDTLLVVYAISCNRGWNSRLQIAISSIRRRNSPFREAIYFSRGIYPVQ